MEDLNYVELMRTLESLRPDDYITLSNSSTTMRDTLQYYKYELLKYWVDDKRSRTELQQYLPNLTFRQMQVLADFYYPTANSIGKYDSDQLFRNAIRAGYSNDNCKQFVDNDEVFMREYCAVSAYVYKRLDLLTQIDNGDNVVAKVLRTGKLDNEEDTNWFIRIMLSHHDVTIEYFCDVLYKLIPDDRDDIKNMFRASPDDEYDEYSAHSSILAESGHPAVVELQKKLGVTPGEPNRTFDQNTLEEFASVALKCGLYKREYPGPGTDDWINYHLLAVDTLSAFDSTLFPTYDLNNDMDSGNWLEVIHKVNTLDRNVILKSSYTEEQHMYSNARLQTYGQMLLHEHPRSVEGLLKSKSLQVADNDSNRVLLQHWCFPNRDVSRMPDPSVYDKLVDYYHPVAVVSDKWDKNDVIVILDRLLARGATEIEVRDFARNMRDISILGLSTMIVLHYYGFDDIIPNNIYPQYADLFTNDVLILNNYEIYVIANHTYLDADEKLSLLSKVEGLDPIIVNAILGYQDDTDIGVMGNILNRAASTAALEKFAAVYNSKFQYADIETIMPYIRSQVDLFARGEYVGSMFPLQLVWQYTDALGEAELYEDAIIELMQNGQYDPYTTARVLTSAGKFYELHTGDITLGLLPNIKFMRRFAC